MGAYMKMAGLDGGITAKGLENTIALSSVNFSIQRKMNTQPGSVADREGTRPSLSEIVVTKEVDKTSPLLIGHVTVGQVIPTVELRFAHSGKDTNIYQVVTLTNVMVSGLAFNYAGTGINPDGSPTADDKVKPTEDISLNYTQIEVKNTPYDSSGKAGSPVAAGYNLETAQAS